jgi:hypothetical protein
MVGLDPPYEPDGKLQEIIRIEAAMAERTPRQERDRALRMIVWPPALLGLLILILAGLTQINPALSLGGWLMIMAILFLGGPILITMLIGVYLWLRAYGRDASD